MSADIEPGQIWKDRTGPAHIRIDEVTPTHVGYIWMDDSTTPGLKGARYVDQFLQDYEPGTPATPAPLDPRKVKAGDTVTLVGTKAKIEGEVEDVQKDTDALVIIQIDNLRFRVTGDDAWLLTAHQPAPEPEPEWKPGTVADVTPHRRPDLASRAVRGEDDMWHNTYGGMWDDDEVSVKPLVVIDPAAVRTKIAEGVRAKLGGPLEAWVDVADDVLTALGIEAS